MLDVACWLLCGRVLRHILLPMNPASEVSFSAHHKFSLALMMLTIVVARTS